MLSVHLAPPQYRSVIHGKILESLYQTMGPQHHDQTQTQRRNMSDQRSAVQDGDASQRPTPHHSSSPPKGLAALEETAMAPDGTKTTLHAQWMRPKPVLPRNPMMDPKIQQEDRLLLAPFTVDPCELFDPPRIIKEDHGVGHNSNKKHGQTDPMNTTPSLSS